MTKQYYKSDEVKELINSIIYQAYKWGWDSALTHFTDELFDCDHEFDPPRKKDPQGNHNFAEIVRRAKNTSRERIDRKRSQKKEEDE